MTQQGKASVADGISSLTEDGSKKLIETFKIPEGEANGFMRIGINAVNILASVLGPKVGQSTSKSVR